MMQRIRNNKLSLIIAAVVLAFVVALVLLLQDSDKPQEALTENSSSLTAPNWKNGRTGSWSGI